MKLQTLKYFVTLAESRSINEAAQKLYIAQPSLSKSLQMFEKELGVQLFLRTESGITLTEAGKKILPEARQILAYYSGWKALGRHDSLRQLHIYVHSSFPDFILPGVILQMKKRYPDLSINYSVCLDPQKHISRDVGEPVLSFFVCRHGADMEKYTQLQGNAPLVLLQGSYHCLVNARSPLAKLDQVSPHDLAEVYLVLPENEILNAEIHTVSHIISLIPPQRIIYVESSSNVIGLIRQDPETYALSYYPALKRYPGVQQGELIPIPFQGRSNDSSLVLFYSRQAYQEHPAMGELIRRVDSAAKQFLQSLGPA